MRNVVALVMIGIGVCACQADEKCNGWAGGLGFSSWGSCGDKRERKIECANAAAAAAGKPPVKCTCTLDGVVGKSFETTDTSKFGTKDTAIKLANEQCGWHLQ